MSRAESGVSSQLVSTDTKITAVFVVLGVVLWYGSRTVTESQPIQFALLLGVGIIVPTLINEFRK
jgi:hypothetical protein